MNRKDDWLTIEQIAALVVDTVVGLAAGICIVAMSYHKAEDGSVVYFVDPLLAGLVCALVGFYYFFVYCIDKDMQKVLHKKGLGASICMVVMRLIIGACLIGTPLVHAASSALAR